VYAETPVNPGFSAYALIHVANRMQMFARIARVIDETLTINARKRAMSESGD